MKASSFKTSQKFFIDSQKLLPLSRFLPQTGRACFVVNSFLDRFFFYINQFQQTAAAGKRGGASRGGFSSRGAPGGGFGGRGGSFGDRGPLRI